MFSVNQDGQLFINQMFVTPHWIQAWLTHGTTSAPGVLNTQIIPPASVPVDAQVTGVVPFQMHQQHMAVALHNQMTLVGQVQSLSGQLAELQRQSSLQSNTEDFQRQMKEKDEEISELNRNIESLRQALLEATAEDTGSDTAEPVTTEESGHESRPDEKDKIIEEKKEELKRLQQALAEKGILLAQQTQTVAEQAEKLHCAECERDKAKEAAETAEQLAKQEKQEKQEKQAQLDRLRSENEQLEKKLAGSRQTVGKLQQEKKEKQEKQAQLDRIRSENEQLKTELARSKQTVGKLQQEKQEKQEKQGQLERTRLGNEQLEKELAGSRQAVGKLQQEKQDAERQQQLLREQAKKNSDQTHKLEAEKDRLNEELQSKEKALKKEKNKVDSYKKLLESKAKELKENLHENKVQRAEADRLREEKKQLRDEQDKKLAEQKERHQKELKAQREKSKQQHEKEYEARVAQLRREHEDEKKKWRKKRNTEDQLTSTEALSSQETEPGVSALLSVMAQNNDLASDSEPGRVLTQPGVPVNTDSAITDMIRVIKMADLYPDTGQVSVDENNGEGRKPFSDREGEQNGKKTGDQIESIIPSVLAGVVAEAVRILSQTTFAYLFPALASGLFSGVIAYRWGQAEPQENRTEPESGNRNNSNGFTGTPATVIPSETVANACDWLGVDSRLRPLCLRLLYAPDSNTINRLLLLHNISVRFPDTLMYPVFSWGYWTASGSSSLSFKELLQMMKQTSLAQPFDVGNLYLDTLKMQDFYLEPVARQETILNWVMDLWQNKLYAIRNDLSFIHSPQQIPGFPVLLGIAVLDVALEGRHEPLSQQLAKHQVNSLVGKLLTQVLKPDDRTHLSAADLSMTLFELDKAEPRALWGVNFNTAIVHGKEAGLLSDCSKMSFAEAKHHCFEFIINGTIWKAKVISGLEKYLTGVLPVLDLGSSGDIEAQYPEVSKQQKIATMRFLLDWIDSYHSNARYAEKLSFIRAALVLAGINSDEFPGTYDQVLQEIWGMQKLTDSLASKAWTERLLTMNRSGGRHPELVFKPLWRREFQGLSLIVEPDVPGEELPGSLEGARVSVVITGATLPDSYLYHWDKKEKLWGKTVFQGGPYKISEGDRLYLYCGFIYGLGSSEKKMRLFFSYNQNCKLRRPYFN